MSNKTQSQQSDEDLHTLVPINAPSNPLVGNLPGDTLNNVTCSLCFVQEVLTCRGEPDELSSDANTGLYYLFGCIISAVRFEADKASPRPTIQSEVA